MKFETTFEPIRFTVRHDCGPKIIDARAMISEIAITPEIGCSIGFEVLRGSTIETKRESKARRRAERAGGRLLRKSRLIKKRRSALDALYRRQPSDDQRL